MTSENTTMGKRIMTLRKAAGMTQEQLAEKLGISPQAVSKWENDISCPDISTVPIIASIFNVSCDELLGIAKPVPTTASEKTPSNKNPRSSRGNMGIGILFVVLGVAFLLSYSSQLPFSMWDILWPAALMGLGIAATIKNRSLFTLGAACIGLFYLLKNLGTEMPFDINWSTAWPVMFILLGLDVLLQNLFPSVFRRDVTVSLSAGFTPDGISKYQLINGFIYAETAFRQEHYEESGEISGGDLKTIFGHCTMDLSHCTFPANAELSAEVSFGRLCLQLPPSVHVISKAESAFGSINITGSSDATSIMLILRGKVSFGSLEITCQ